MSDEMAKNGHQDRATERRLDSWKEIAAYLNRDVRSVRRWEKTEGLPVHRLFHNRQASIYAYPSELDAWLRERSTTLPAADPSSPALLRKRWVSIGLAFTGLAALALALAFWRPAPRLQPRDWVLVAGLENHSGNPRLDHALDYALARSLGAYVGVVPRERVEDTLRLMRLAPGTRIDAPLGREIAVRDGNIHGLVTGRVEILGDKYVVSGQVMEPATGRSLTGFRSPLVSEEGLLTAMDEAARSISRSVLAETKPAGSSLPRVSTRSLRALELFAQAEALAEQTNFAAAEELLGAALAEDDDFALAHMQLAWALHWQHPVRHASAVQHHAKRALELSPRLPEAERYLIRGGYHFLTRDFAQSKAAYDALLQLHPDHYSGLNEMIFLLEESLQEEAAVAYRVRLADARPHGFLPNLLAAESLVVVVGHRAAAQPYLDRLYRLASPEWERLRPYESYWLRFLRPYESWLAGDPQPLRQAAEEAWGELDNKKGNQKNLLAEFVGHFYLALGDPARAESAFQQIGHPIRRPLTLALAALLQDRPQDVPRLLRGLVPPGERPRALAAVLLIRAGALREARKLIWTPAGPGFPSIVAGELALAEGRRADAIRMLREGLAYPRAWGNPLFFLGSESLARAWWEQGNTPEAIRVLENAIAEQRRAFPWREIYLLRLKSYLAFCYREAGRPRDAERLDRELRAQRTYAPPGQTLSLAWPRRPTRLTTARSSFNME